MTIATKAEAQTVLNWARTKAQNAMEARRNVNSIVDADAADLHYQRCIRELEDAINDYAMFDVTGDDE